MPTIAELEIKLDSTPVEKGTKALNDFAAAADKAAKAKKGLNDVNANGGGGGNPSGGADDEAKKVKNLSDAIDAQTRKLSQLAAQRKALNDSNLKTTDPEEYKRLNAVIDSNIELTRRQGNALDTLAAKQAKETAQKEASAKAAAALQDKAARALAAREALEARFAASQQRQLDATIAGLSRQIKAQEEYNRTIQVLNTARATGGMNGTPGMSAAEYDSYVKLAAVKRDAALATADNTKEVERAQRAFDASVASLGRVERAEAVYAKNLRDSNEALRLNLITTDQYNTKLASFAAKRDAAIAAANSNADAERRFSEQLRSVLQSYDPVLRATDSYTSSVKVLAQGLQNGVLSVEAFNRALNDQRVALDNVKNAQPGSADYQAKQYQSALDRLLPYTAQIRNLDAAEKVLLQTKAAGKVVTDQEIAQYDKATAAIAAERAEIERLSQAQRRGNSAKQDAAALRGLPAQFTDVVVSLQGGQAPLTVLLQQGGQVKDMFGGVGNAFKAVGTALLGMITPMAVIGAGLVAVAYSFHAGAAEAIDFNKAMAASSGFSGATAASFVNLRKSISDTAGTLGLAAEALSAMERSGKITVEQFEAIGIGAVKMQRITGQEVSKTVEEFASLAKDPTSAVINLTDKYHFLTSAIYSQISSLQRQGDLIGATTLAQNEMAAGAARMADNIGANLGTLERGWKAVKETAAGAWDTMLGLGRQQTSRDQLAYLEENLKTLQRTGGAVRPVGGGKVYAGEQGISDLKDEVKFLKQAIEFGEKEQQLKKQRTANEEQATEAAVRGQKTIETTLIANQGQLKTLENQLALVKKSIVDVNNDAAKGTVTPQQIEQQRLVVAALEKKIADEKDRLAKAGKTKSVAVDTRDVQEVKSNLELIVSEYSNQYKKVTAMGDANLVSKEATFQSQKAILIAEAKAVSDSYDQQIEAIKKLQNNKTNSAGANISLDNQLTKAEAAKVKAMEESDAKQEVLATKEKGRLDDRTAAIEAYNDALRLQIQNVSTAGDRAVNAVGKGDRQGQLDEALAENDRSFAKDQASLAKSLGKGMDPIEYAEKLRDLTAAHTEMADQIVSNDERIQAANNDWTNGFTKAVQNLADEANNMAGAVNTAVSGAFDSMGDALGNFVVTGKLNFRDLAVSIISDMAKIAAKQAASSALSSLFGVAMTVGSAYFGGGANGFASGSAAATSSSLGGSAAGYSSAYFPQAKGGGWTGGTQFFAQGGAFTNSVVSSPTSFGMSGGGRGVMGEAGPEAIVPLARSSDGSLGVRMMGSGGSASGGVNVFVNITDSGVSATSDEPGLQQFGSELGAFVDSRYRVLLTRDLKDGGAIKNSIKM